MKNVIVGQSGGPTSVINSSLAGVFAAAKASSIPKIYGMKNGIKGLLERRFVNLYDQILNDMDIELLKRTPSSFLGSCRYKLPKIEESKEVYAEIFSILKELEVGYFFYIGGNDSMDTIMKLSTYGEEIKSDIRFIGVPKTVDNDLAVTDHSPGFGSAAKYIAATMKEVVLDAHVYGNSTATIVEIMGRNTGWLSASAALSKDGNGVGPDLIFLPENTFDIDSFVEKVSKIASKQPAVVVISEGIKLADGRYVYELARATSTVDAFGHKHLSGTASTLSNIINEKLGIKARAIEFSTMQRAAAHISSLTDVNEAFMAGQAGFEAAKNGETNKVIIFVRQSQNPYICTTDAMSIAKMANIEKHVPSEWIKDDYVTQEFIDYALPLIQGELSPYFAKGIPQHLLLK